jgi:hypothetical protein
VDGTPEGHLWIAAGKGRRELAGQECCGGRNRAGRPRVDHTTGHWISFPSGSFGNSGHIMLVWEANGVTYDVSLHGHSSLNERLDRIIANHVVYIR